MTCASQNKRQIVEFELISNKKVKSALWGNFLLKKNTKKLGKSKTCQFVKRCKMNVHFSVGTTNLSTHLGRHHKIITEIYVFCFIKKTKQQHKHTKK